MSGTSATRGPSARHAIVWAGGLAGALDIGAAFAQAYLNGRTPTRVLQGIAMGWLGRRSLALGTASAVLGLATHFLIATTAAAVYWAASRRFPQLVRRAWVWGACYGLVVYAVMYEIVIPLSAIHRHVARTPQALITGLLIHVFCVGLPIAFVVRGHTPRSQTSSI